MIYLDTETFSATPIADGTYRYTADCECMIVTWAVDDGPVQHIDMTDTGRDPAIDRDFLRHIRNPQQILVAHNAMFDRQVLKQTLGLDIPVERWFDTMVQALSHSLPGSLDLLCDILGIGEDQAKVKDGRRLINLFCKPRPQSSKIRRATRETHPEDWAKFIDYARADIDATRAIHKKMPQWNYGAGRPELALWQVDQKINDRGMYVDVAFAQAAIAAVEKEQAVLKLRTQDMTSGEVESTTQRDSLLLHVLAEYGVGLPDLQKATLQRRLDDPDLPAELKELLNIRLQVSSTSTSKYKALVKAVNDDSRLRGTKQFCGATRTGRWAGRVFQPDNLPRYNIDVIAAEMHVAPKDTDAEVIAEYLSAGADAIIDGSEDLIFGNVMALASNSVRSVIAAPPGKKLVVADLANIEGRVLAWLAGEEWKLQAFRDYDAGTGPDLYKLAYAKAFRLPHDVVGKSERSIGKVMELAMGYAGGAGAFLTFAATYKIDLDDMATKAREGIPDHIWQEAENFHEWSIKDKRPTYGLSKDVFCVCDSLKRMWREAHPMVSTFWYELEDAVKTAIYNPGTAFQCRKLTIRRDGAWLRIVLPSGRAVCYPSPRVSDDGKISYKGVNHYTRKWERINTYGGKGCENVTQAFARDVLAYAMPEIEAQGYEIVLHVHDEIVAEVPDTPEYSAEALASLMAINQPWSEGLPLAAEGFETDRYRKG